MKEMIMQSLINIVQNTIVGKLILICCRVRWVLCVLIDKVQFYA